MKNSIGVVGFFGSGGSDAASPGTSESHTRALTTRSKCGGGMRDVNIAKIEYELSGSWILCRISRDMRRKDFHSCSAICFVSSRSPSVLNECIISQKPGYL